MDLDPEPESPPAEQSQDFESDIQRLPEAFQPLLSREASRSIGAGQNPSVREIDGSAIPVRDLRAAPEDTGTQPILGQDYMRSMENEAKNWALKGERLWQ